MRPRIKLPFPEPKSEQEFERAYQALRALMRQYRRSSETELARLCDLQTLNDFTSLFAVLPEPRFAWSFFWTRGAHPWAEVPQPSFCRLMHSCAEGRYRCQLSDVEMLRASQTAAEPRVFYCHAGLFHAMVPITAQDRYAGCLVGGPAVPDALTEKRRNQITRKVEDLPLDRVALEQAIADLPTMSRDIIRESIRAVWHGVNLAVAVAEYRRQIPRRAEAARRPGEPTHVAVAREYVRSNLDQPLSLALLCSEVLKMDRSHFARMFRRHAGMTFGQYVLRQKMEQARRLLAHSDLPITAVASSLGFADWHYFGRVFKRSTGQSPRTFRRHSRLSS